MNREYIYLRVKEIDDWHLILAENKVIGLCESFRVRRANPGLYIQRFGRFKRDDDYEFKLVNTVPLEITADQLIKFRNDLMQSYTGCIESKDGKWFGIDLAKKVYDEDVEECLKRR